MRLARATPVATPAKPARMAAETLDASWDKRLSSGRATPDMVIDLHGMTRAEARDYLRLRLSDARLRGHRILLVITGKGGRAHPAPADLAANAPVRGAIRAELPRWLGEADISADIAAVRRAHPKHGGSGAVYLILRRNQP